MVCDGRETPVHVANSGRLEELLRPSNLMLLAPAPAVSQRKTAYHLVLVEADGVLVSADARLPNALFQEAVEAGRLSGFEGYDRISGEVPFGGSRLDFRMSGPDGTMFVEVKSVTLVEGGVGLFPDAPTLRGRRHVDELAEAVRQGHRAAVVFVIQRPDASSMSPNRAADPDFCRALDRAVSLGVEVRAYRCGVSRESIEVAAAVPYRPG